LPEPYNPTMSAFSAIPPGLALTDRVGRQL
jgi:hypothetical protein